MQQKVTGMIKGKSGPRRKVKRMAAISLERGGMEQFLSSL